MIKLMVKLASGWGVRELQDLGAPNPPQGFLVRGQAGRVINKLSSGRGAPLVEVPLVGGDTREASVASAGCGRGAVSPFEGWRVGGAGEGSYVRLTDLYIAQVTRKQKGRGAPLVEVPLVEGDICEGVRAPRLLDVAPCRSLLRPEPVVCAKR